MRPPGPTLPPGVKLGMYRIKPPLIKPSKVGVGGWAINFAVGCVHACPFCYVDYILKKRRADERLRDLVSGEWGYYFAVPVNIDEAIRETPWWRWRGKWVTMSTMHDPYLPQLYKWAGRILRKALMWGVRVEIITRSALVLKDIDVLRKHSDRVKVIVSIATSNEEFASIIEPRAPRPSKRVRVVEELASNGVRVSVHVAPIIPPNPIRRDVKEDLEELAAMIKSAGVREVSGESLHVRGANVKVLEKLLGCKLDLRGWDYKAMRMFREATESYGLKAVWYPGV